MFTSCGQLRYTPPHVILEPFCNIGERRKFCHKFQIEREVNSRKASNLQYKVAFTPRKPVSSVEHLANREIHLGRGEVSEWQDAQRWMLTAQAKNRSLQRNEFDRDCRESYRNCNNCLHTELTPADIFDCPAILAALKETGVLFSQQISMWTILNRMPE
ncbi:hypothetical protein TNCV_3461001 [Trichonephila clavipes]|nr:hypothetical protein TNCV_3461001 [Trichonephila clavipes]